MLRETYVASLLFTPFRVVSQSRTHRLSFPMRFPREFLARFSEKEQHSIKGLMKCHEEPDAVHPLSRLDIDRSLHMTTQTGGIIETLQALSPRVWLEFRDTSSKQRYTAAATENAGCATVSEEKEKTFSKDWRCIEMLAVPDEDQTRTNSSTTRSKTAPGECSSAHKPRIPSTRLLQRRLFFE